MHEADELEQKIDKAFLEKICEPRRRDIVQFFCNILSFKEGYRLLENREELEVVDIFYYANEPLSYISADASYGFYDDEYQLDSPNLSLDSYSYLKIDEVVIKVLLAEGISSKEVEADNFDTASYWENKHELEMNFLIGCWQEATVRIPPKFKAFLYASDGTGIPIDLSTGLEIGKHIPISYSIEDYLAKKGIYPKKLISEKEEETEEESGTFWKRLFGRN